MMLHVLPVAVIPVTEPVGVAVPVKQVAVQRLPQRRHVDVAMTVPEDVIQHATAAAEPAQITAPVAAAIATADAKAAATAVPVAVEAA